MTTLHLIDAASPQARPPTLALLADTVRAQAAAGQDVRVLLLGGGALGRDAAAVGLSDAHRVTVPFGRAELGLAALRRVLGDIPSLRRIHAWSAGALRAAAWLRPTVPRLVSVVCMPDEAMHRAIRTARRRAPISVIALDAGVAAALREGGTAPDAVEAVGPVLPSIMQGGGAPGQRSTERCAQRKRWASPESSRDCFVIALLGDPVEAHEADQGSLVIGLMCEAMGARLATPPTIALLVHPSQRKYALAQRLVVESGVGVRLIQDAGLAGPWQVMAGCDAALVLTDRGIGLSLGAAMAAGVPVVAPNRLRCRQRLMHERTGLLAKDERARHLAYQLEQLVLDADRAARLAAAAQEKAGNLAPWLAALATAGRGLDLAGSTSRAVKRPLASA